MNYKTLSNEFKISSLGLGTWLRGGRLEPDYSNDEQEIIAIKEAIKLGYTHIDTAAMYGGGHCEELVGEAIKDFDRDKLFVTTKVFATELAYDKLIASANLSLKRLGLEYVDLFLIHATNPEIPLKETMKAMDYLVENKLTKFIGVSNFPLSELKEAQKYSKNKIVVNQVEYSLLTRNESKYGCKNMESEVIPYCQENDIIIMAERPIERGILLKPHHLLDSLVEKYNKTKAQIAINWLISKKNVVTIPKASNLEHLKENLGALGWNLSGEDMKLLDETDFSSLGKP